ncbi:MAG: sugar kinase, partial [Acidobacteriales bacterium]|nr:sugar kinase [Terriglobales bacterium]
VGRVGQDVLGDIVLRDLIRLGVDVRGVAQCDAHSTSGTFILNVRGQDRRYIHCFGANAAFRGSDVNRQLLGQAKVFYVGGFLAMPAFSAEELLEVLSDAKRLGIITVLDVAIPAGLPAPLEQVELVLGATDYFLPNEDEARMLTGLDQPAEQIERLQSGNPDCTVVITRGERGTFTKRGPVFIDSPAFSVNAVDKSGAGDAFSAGFITGLLEGWPLEYTLEFASAVGASCTTALGCTNGVFSFDQATSFIAQHHSAGVQLRR